MRKFIYIVFAATLFVTSCEQEQPVMNNGNGKLPIFNGFMQFSTEVSTRSQLATDMKGKAFGVIGFEYSKTSSWTGAKSTTSPNIFYDLRVDCDANNGTCTYDWENPTQGGKKPKPWGDYRYAFFAYHPYAGAGISLSPRTATNTPTLTYTYDWLNPTDNPSWLILDYDVDRDGNDNDEVIDVTVAGNPVFDLMTAENVDATGSSNGGRVAFDFKHRLCAIEVLANNYNENIYEYDEVPVFDENGNPVYKVDEDGDQILDGEGKPIQATEKVVRIDANGKPIIAEAYYLRDEGGELILDDKGNPQLVQTNARQDISNLTLTLDGLTNTSMTIPLSTKSDEAAPVYTTGQVGTRHFLISDKMVTVPAFNEVTDDGRGEGVATSISQLGTRSGLGGYVMLIPQAGSNEGIRGTLIWDQLASFKANATEENPVNNTFASTIEFKPGKLYQVYINFVGNGITIALIEAGNWDVHNVKHTFE